MSSPLERVTRRGERPGWSGWARAHHGGAHTREARDGDELTGHRSRDTGVLEKLKRPGNGFFAGASRKSQPR